MRNSIRIAGIVLCLLSCAWPSAAQPGWKIADGGRRIVWTPVPGVPHYDHIEMSGEEMAFVLRWGVDASGAFACERSLVFPLLRTVPNDTHASLVYRTAADIPSLLSVSGLTLCGEKVQEVSIDGALAVRSLWNVGWTYSGTDSKAGRSPEIEMTRTVFPSKDKPLMCEVYRLVNVGGRHLEVTVPETVVRYETDPARGVTGGYIIEGSVIGAGLHGLPPGDTLSFAAVFQGYRAGELPVESDPAGEYAARMDFIRNDIDGSLVLETPDSVIDTEFRFAKIRASESIIRTRNGYMHAPGGEVFYAALWANDQAEYVNPFFPFLGYDVGNESALNCYRHFARFMNDGYRSLPSSIIAEGTDIWAGAGDRGDAAMIAYGASRYLLARASRQEAEELWPLVEWCLEYCRRQLTTEGVVASDSDELEGRFPAGDANLSTSVLYYDALISASYLAGELGLPRKVSSSYKVQAEKLRKAIERYFGAEVSGYETWRYYDGNNVLRSWICLPLVAGIDYHKEGTVDALLGPELMTENGVLTEQGDSTFWDRATLYALRGIFCAGYPDRASDVLHAFSERRLLGEHVPYPVEAWPEGSQRHLSAESGLYCRIITEGLFGIRPTGFDSFDLAVSMPSDWDRMALRHIRAFGRDFDIIVERTSSGKLAVTVPVHGGRTGRHIITDGSSLRITLE